MSRSRPITLFAGAALMPLTALAVAACGGGGSATAATSKPTTAATPAPKSAAPHAPSVRVAKTRLGKALVDSRGRTLYLFTKDSGTKSTCSGACATAWPPLRATGKPTVSGGAKASQVGLRRQAAGHLQRPPALPVRQGHEVARHEWRGPDGVRRQLVRGLPDGEPNRRPDVEVGRRLIVVACGGTGRSARAEEGPATGFSRRTKVVADAKEAAVDFERHPAEQRW
jgi:predicted lipoprotein with Yx(FWY)xxD motif